MTKHRWSRMVAVFTLSVLAPAAVSAQTARWPSPLPAPGVRGVRSSTPRWPEMRPPSAAILRHHSNEAVRLPPVDSPALPVVPPAASAPSGVPGVAGRGYTGVDGTWSEEGRYLVINLNGQQLRLIKTESPASPDPASPENPDGGDVNGRLSHHGQPLVNCEVALIPLRKSWTGYRLNHSGELLARTDGNGMYYLRNVPAGPYKLRWRPAGESSWIRRAEIRPDVRVRARETSQVKEIRVALRTIN